MAVRILFLLRHRDQPWGHYGYHLSSGLRNSVAFILLMLKLLGIPAKMVEVEDDNAIDREVTAYRPTHCILEALWVRPFKFDVLKPKHPHVHWIVRDHSETPFVANEGMAMGWIAGYLQRGVEVSCNAPRALIDLEALGVALGYPQLISYSPNFYPIDCPNDHRHLRPHHPRADDTLRIGCFGAIRPLKNQLLQAIAAIRYAGQLGKKLDFYVNSARIEQGGNPILKNLRELFAAVPRARLVEIGWLEHDKFLEILWTMDICLQVSFSETFNIVSADCARCAVPVIASREVPWLGDYAIADANSSTSILNKMLQIHRHNLHQRLQDQWRDLVKYSNDTRRIWRERFG